MSAALNRFRKALDKAEERLLAFLLALMTVLIFVQVVLRYVFNTGLVWSLEATTYAFAALVLFGMSYGVRTRTHIAVDLFIKRMPPRVAVFVSMLALLICIAYALIMLYGSSIFVSRLYQLGNMARDVPAPKWLLTATMPIGFTLLAIRFAEAGWQLWTGKLGQADEEEAA